MALCNESAFAHLNNQLPYLERNNRTIKEGTAFNFIYRLLNLKNTMLKTVSKSLQPNAI